ncbi:MAG: threonine-phosphate decarboxylase CobD [Thalassospira sp.]|uniref:threonine-phosphate decarboxylase CobD n=1 Tax=Thalassospira sp. TaxID=1912094 RepID=UPI003A83A25C
MAHDIATSEPSAPINHGGAIDVAARKYGIAAADWLDLSTGINPRAYPVPEIDLCHWQRLPLRSELDQLKETAAAYYIAPSPGNLVCTPGTQALIQTIPYWLRDIGPVGKVHIMGPTYGEHEKCWQRAGHDCEIHLSAPGERLGTARDILTAATAGSVVILVNPNNPDGKLISPSDILELGKLASDRDCWLIVDEAFIDCTPDQSACQLIDEMPRTIILRSFGKFFGLAGARLGFAVMASDLAINLEQRIGPWAVPGPTISIGVAAFSDTDWQFETLTRLHGEGIRLDAMIARYTNLSPDGATDLFRYYDGTECVSLADHLGKAGILVRLFDQDANKMRFGLPDGDHNWDRLETALSAWKRG